MLDPTAQEELARVLTELERLIALRMEERRVTSAGAGGPDAARADELLRRPVAWGGGSPAEEGIPSAACFRGEGPLASLIAHYRLTAPEALMVVAALAPEVDERFLALYPLLSDRPGSDGLTGEVLRNLVARSFKGRLEAAEMLAPDARLRGLGLLALERSEHGLLAGRVRLNRDAAAWLLGRAPDEPELSPEFPAQRISTVRRLGDLVLPDSVRDRLKWAVDRIRQRERVLDNWRMGEVHDNPRGFHLMLHGPPGCGKSSIAAALGREAGDRPVFRVDLSLVTSKWLGETEKALSRLFDRAEERDWILLFDECDAIFGRRGEVHDARDRHSNQQISYLLQRLECFSGVTVLSTNMLANVDEAFLRRLHALIAVPPPAVGARSKLWRSACGPHLPVADQVNFDRLAERYPMSGSEIRNAVFHAAYRAAANGGRVTPDLLVEGVRVEFEKGGRPVPETGASP